MQMIQNLFQPANKILCPYCLARIHYRREEDIRTCPCEANHQLPILYIQDADRIPPLFIQIIGWSGVGKTVYLQSLTFMLRYLNRVWHSRYATNPITQPALDFVRNVQEFMNTGRLPIPTQRTLQQAYIMQVLNMERWGSRTLVMRDVAGETFDNIEFDIKYTPYLLHVPVTFLMISLPDLENPRMSDRNMDNLITGYINTLATYDRDYRHTSRQVIVILSKADKLRGKLPDEIQSYLLADPLAEMFRLDSTKASSFDVHDYMETLRSHSTAIETWLNHTYPTAASMRNLALDHRIDMVYTMLTSTGADPVTAQDEHGNEIQVVVDMAPRHVLDPFFWALDFSSKPT